jgi:S-methylmethionine-dependent homocysteine/selenocysteine methylase
MKTYRKVLPQLNGQQFITDGGLETTLIFKNDISLPHFAAFDLYSREGGPEIIKAYYEDYIKIAHKHQRAFILESATWRCNPNWGYKLGYDPEALSIINKQAIKQLEELRREHQNGLPCVISGCIGPAADGYSPAEMMSVEEAEQYHHPQLADFARAGADMVSAMTMNYGAEAMGIVRAAMKEGIPVSISFTLETDGSLPSGESLQEIIETIDAGTERYPAYYMINCAHPEHFKVLFAKKADWQNRILGIRANASEKSHEELDNSETLDAGDINKLVSGLREVRSLLPGLNVLGGCCGTDHTHIEAMCSL